MQHGLRVEGRSNPSGGSPARSGRPRAGPGEARIRTRQPPPESGGPAIREFGFAIQIFIETHFGFALLPWRRLVAGYPYRKIPLTQGRFARVDQEDYAGLVRHRWCVSRQSNTFYAVRAEGRRQIRMHRAIVNAPPGLVVDHIDHNGLHNVKRNLRQCTKSQNARNQRPQVGCSSKYAGVGRLKDGKWYARIQENGRQCWLGTFKTERQAARARDKAARRIFGRFAHLNFPKERRWTNLLSRIKEQIARVLGKLREHRAGP